MSDSILKELTYAEQIMYQAKFEDALKIVTNLEKKKINETKEQLSILILKSKIYCYKEQYKKAVEVGEKAYQLSQKIGLIPKVIDSLVIKAYIIFYGKLDQALEYISEAERLINSILKDSSSEFSKQKADILFIKSIVCHYATEHSKAIELSQEWLTLEEDLKEKLEIALMYCQMGDIYIFKSEPDKALGYAMKSLVIQKELNNQIGIGASLNLIGLCHYMKGDFDRALKTGRQGLNIDEIGIVTKFSILHLLGAIYKEMGELDRTLSYYNRAVKLAEKEGYNNEFLENLMGIGATYRMKGDFDKAIEYLQHSMALSEKFNSVYGMSSSLFYLILTSLDNNSLEQAQLYLTRLEQFTNQYESKVFSQVHSITKALVLKQSSRIRNRTEAELLLKQIIGEGISTPQLNLLALVNLCEIFLEELSFTNNIEVLDELNPLIAQISKIAEKQNAYLWLAEIKLLQAKLALIQMQIKEAEQLITQSQQIAELHGLNLLAIRISVEHDILLQQLSTWKNLEKENAPMSERIKLASFKGVIDRMQGKRAIEPPELTHEIPILLLIIGGGGFPLFSNPFTKEWSFKNDLISGFLTAFDSFSGEIFAKRLDRAKFGEFTILMQSVSSFSICYIFKGQTYLANQKLTQFVESIQNSDIIRDTMNKYLKANRVIEIKDHPIFESLINEIFIKKAPEINA